MREPPNSGRLPRFGTTGCSARAPTDRPCASLPVARQGMARHGMASDRIEAGVQALNALVQSEVIGKCVSFRDSQGYHYRCRATLPGRGPMSTDVR